MLATTPDKGLSTVTEDLERRRREPAALAHTISAMENESFPAFGGEELPVPSAAALLYSKAMDHPTILLAILLLVTIIITRLISSSKPIRTSSGAIPIPSVPYLFPILGHLPSMGWDATGFTRRLRNRYQSTGAYSLNFGGTVHNILFTPSLATALLNTKDENAEANNVFKLVMGRVFGYPHSVRREEQIYDEMASEVNGLYRYFSDAGSLGEMVERTVRKTKEGVRDFVTFSTSLVDQTLWERSAGAEVKTDEEGERVVEADLMQLVRDFCALNANPSIIGSDFINNFPQFFENLWTMDAGFLMLASGLPRWVPIPALTRAHIARRNALQMLEQFEVAIDKWAAGEDPGQEWRDLDDVGPVVKGRVRIYREHGCSIRARAAIELALMWAANANSNLLVFWMLERIFADKQLLAMIRDEVAPYVRAVQPKKEFPVPEAPRLESVDMQGLTEKCPLLKSCYVESLRLDTASWSLKVVNQDFELKPRDKEAQALLLRKGEYVHVAHDLHNTDPNAFENPDVWKADRHVKYSEDGKMLSADLGTIRPYGRLPMLQGQI